MISTRIFPGEPQAVTAARRFVRETLIDLPPEIVDHAELMASELATNCVRHARTEFELSIDLEEPVRIELSDTGGGHPRALSPTQLDSTGRGLQIVAALSESWGVVPNNNGKTVWFTLHSAPA